MACCCWIPTRFNLQCANKLQLQVDSQHRWPGSIGRVPRLWRLSERLTAKPVLELTRYARRRQCSTLAANIETSSGCRSFAPASNQTHAANNPPQAGGYKTGAHSRGRSAGFSLSN